jgi:hypothetical protein
MFKPGSVVIISSFEGGLLKIQVRLEQDKKHKQILNNHCNELGHTLLKSEFYYPKTSLCLFQSF